MMGRKRVSTSGELLNAQLLIRLSSPEREQLDAAAASQEQPTSTWARRTLLNASEDILHATPKKPSRDKKSKD